MIQCYNRWAKPCESDHLKYQMTSVLDYGKIYSVWSTFSGSTGSTAPCMQHGGVALCDDGFSKFT